MALLRESVATKFSCGFLADGGGGDPLHCSIEKQMRMLNALHILTRGWGREKMTFFFFGAQDQANPGLFFTCSLSVVCCKIHSHCSSELQPAHSPPLLLSGEQPDQNGCDPTPRITPFAMEMRTWRLLTMCSSESSC